MIFALILPIVFELLYSDGTGPAFDLPGRSGSEAGQVKSLRQVGDQTVEDGIREHLINEIPENYGSFKKSLDSFVVSPKDLERRKTLEQLNSLISKLEQTRQSLMENVEPKLETQRRDSSSVTMRLLNQPDNTRMRIKVTGHDPQELRRSLANLSILEEYSPATSRELGSSYILPVLKLVNYDNSTIPKVFEDIPVNVLFRLNIVHLANFDSELMEYNIDIEMEMIWFDYRLSNNFSRSVRLHEKAVLDRIWRPDPYFVNSKHSQFHKVTFPNFRMSISPSGVVSYTMRVSLQPACQMVFCRFPHDRQLCSLVISSISYPNSSVNFLWHPKDPVELASPIRLPELKLKAFYTDICTVEGRLIRSSCLQLIFHLERDTARFIVEKYIPSTLAMMFAWVAPYVPYNYEDVRIITPITVLLTLVQMGKGQQIRTSYLTSMDIWFSAMKIFSAISLVESLVVLALIKRSRTVAKQMLKASNQLEKENFRMEQDRLTRLYHQLDHAARYLSPLFFVLFILLYVTIIANGDESNCVTHTKRSF
ncbi:hypothetical protein AB6A40_003925 [Gnathostoma spinigerum]|uniref:Neurotransmitter-gated ion-channel ligand-binding domain-containing protein n=1 Tax=Gnathostoma spinigerum TaxID=75299 RepID=A0ABD6EIK6_9BILA